MDERCDSKCGSLSVSDPGVWSDISSLLRDSKLVTDRERLGGHVRAEVDQQQFGSVQLLASRGTFCRS